MKARIARSVMVAIRDLDASRGLIRKAAGLAKQRRAALHLVHAIALPHGALQAPMASVRAAVRGEIEDRRQALLKIAAGVQAAGVKTLASVVWDYPVADALVRMVLRHRPQLLVVESHRHGRFARLWLSNTDWELVRQCPCPLWLSKTTNIAAQGHVIAAIDPYHAHAKPAALDDLILRQALEAAGGDVRRVTACHVFSLPRLSIVDGAVETYWMTMSEAERTGIHADALQRINKLADKYGLGKNVLVLDGDPTYQLQRLARRRKASVIVMGAVSRSALKRIFIGNTAERLLDEAGCDVLVVKPRGFKTGVSRIAPRSRPSLAA